MFKDWSIIAYYIITRQDHEGTGADEGNVPDDTEKKGWESSVEEIEEL